MIKFRPKEARDALAPFAGAILLSLWGFVTFEGNWLERLVLAVVFGFLAQAIALIAYFTAVYISAALMGRELDTKSIDIYDHRVAGALLLTAFVYVLGQHWRNSARETIARCVQEETRTTAFGQFSNAVDLVEYCTNEYNQQDFSPDD